jgi:hypothetical protein
MMKWRKASPFDSVKVRDFVSSAFAMRNKGEVKRAQHAAPLRMSEGEGAELRFVSFRQAAEVGICQSYKNNICNPLPSRMFHARMVQQHRNMDVNEKWALPLFFL